jgi:hypothetical protein
MTAATGPDLACFGHLAPRAGHHRLRAASTTVLDMLTADRALLSELTDAVPNDPHLVGLCEHYDILDKIVLHDAPAGWRLRLHVFLDGYFDRPHNHRWTYTSRILSGSYAHPLRHRPRLHRHGRRRGSHTRVVRVRGARRR